jgi:hypothetical protein
MDIQARKIHFVQEFLRLKNEELISKFEKILMTEKQKGYARTLEPMTMVEFNRIIENAENDSKSGRLTPASDLKNEINSWI